MEKRVIKFRAWDNRRKRMLQPFLTFEKNPADGLVTENTNWHDDEDMEQGWDTSNQVNELMQFTGLLDKHGVEIYEGDIVRYMLEDLPAPDEKVYTEFVRFNNGCFEIEGAPLYVVNVVCEVIGNIYQHPEKLAQLEAE